MKKIRRIIRAINIAIVKVLLTIAYIVIILPYRMFVKKPEAGWAKPQQATTDLSKMW